MDNRFSRRTFLAGLLATTATGACANAPQTSVRPTARPLRGRAEAAPEAERLIASAELGGSVGYIVADARTGRVLEGRNGKLPMPPASVMKSLTTLYAFDRLGAGYRFRTQLLATGPVTGGRLAGDLILVGGGDPTLDTEALAGLARNLRAAGVTEVTGRFRYYSGALPIIREIEPGQQDHLSYNPAISGLNLNYNRVYFEWKRQGGGYAVTMDARSDKRRPLVRSARMQIEDRGSPVYTFRDTAEAEAWTVARGALGKGGGRWLPVRHPDRYAAEVFRSLALAEGVKMSEAASTGAVPGGTVLAEVASAGLPVVARDMLEYSTNMTAEVLGLTSSGERNLRASAARMASYLRDRHGLGAIKLSDHSGLGPASRVSAADMVQALVSVGPEGPLMPLMKTIPMRGNDGKVIPNHEVSVVAKTGTLNFVSTLAGYATVPGGRVLAFAIFTGDTKRRARFADSEEEVPAGAIGWNRRSKDLQQGLIQRWGRVHSA